MNSGGSRRLKKESTDLGMRITVTGHRSWQRPSERIIKACPFKTIWEVAKKLKVNHSMTIWHLKQIGNVKKLDKWVFQELTANQKNHHFEVSSSLILHNNNKPFLDQTVTCNGKWILYNSLRQSAQWLAREAAPKHFPKPNLHQKKGHSHCLVVCCPSDPLQLSESWWNHHIREACSANWWDALKTATPAASVGQYNGPSSSWQCLTTGLTNSVSKV